MRVFPSMLTGDARERFKAIGRSNPSWQEAVEVMTATFETSAQKHRREAEWHAIDLADMCADEQGAKLPLSQNVLRLISVLSIWQHSLSQQLQGEYFLRARFYEACRSHQQVPRRDGECRKALG
ncbi:MAG: hypothetical protein SEPTF4163_003702 [Sporothrix epigloea]